MARLLQWMFAACLVTLPIAWLKADTLPNVIAFSPALAAEPRVVAARLFGGVARGTATKDSDFDIAVLFSEPVPARLGGPLDRLQESRVRHPHLPAEESGLPDLSRGKVPHRFSNERR